MTLIIEINYHFIEITLMNLNLNWKIWTSIYLERIFKKR